ncbi:MAG TPA: signal peptidase II [Phycisphaerae bacterium]|nr:signal peptidase II [Phycisphaerae bacterium]
MPTPGRKGLAVADGGSHLRLWLTVGLGTFADLASKYLGWDFLGGPPEGGGRIVSVLPGWLRLVASENPGIVFGIDFGAYLGLGPAAGQIVTVVLTAATSALIFYVFATSQSRQRWIHVWCGLILAGAAGNLFDRIAFGHVRDLVQFTVEMGGRPLWPFVFNLADVYLVVGVIAVAWTMLFGSGAREAERGENRAGKES